MKFQLGCCSRIRFWIDNWCMDRPSKISTIQFFWRQRLGSLTRRMVIVVSETYLVEVIIVSETYFFLILMTGRWVNGSNFSKVGSNKQTAFSNDSPDWKINISRNFKVKSLNYHNISDQILDCYPCNKGGRLKFPIVIHFGGCTEEDPHFR